MSKETVTIPKSVLIALVKSHVSMLASFAAMGKQRPPEDYGALFGFDGVKEHLVGANCEAEKEMWDSYKRLRDQEDTLFCQMLFDAGLTSIQISRVLEAMDKTCPHCRDRELGCQCANDE